MPRSASAVGLAKRGVIPQKQFYNKMFFLNTVILVSHDFQTMPRYFRQFTQGRRSPGVLLVRQDLPVGEAIETLLLIWEASDADGG